MKALVILLLVTAASTLLAGDPSKPAHDPFAGAFFPPELVLMARDRIGLSPEQLEALQSIAGKMKARSEELRAQLEKETVALATLVRADRIDEKTLHLQLDKALDLEREVKHLHMGGAASIKNLLTVEQQAKLREIAQGGIEQLGEDTKKRLMEKVERVKEAVQQRAGSGSDPSEVLKTMGEKFKPLMDAGKVIEAETLIDQILVQLSKEKP
jgi:Spy/CpxP family protein refolding chaperone